MTEKQIKSAKTAVKANAAKRKVEAGKTIVTRHQRAAKATPKKVAVKQPRKVAERVAVKKAAPKLSYSDLHETDQRLQDAMTPKFLVPTDLKDIKRRFYEEQGVKYNSHDLAAVALAVALVYTTGWVLWLAFGGK